MGEAPGFDPEKKADDEYLDQLSREMHGDVESEREEQYKDMDRLQSGGLLPSTGNMTYSEKVRKLSKSQDGEEVKEYLRMTREYMNVARKRK
ncbi:MAG: hypothetical protein HQ538_02900 [Parcubacteria group bacterium]|nr:hypothetical protein [Parcubacteria group bacterium]